MAILEVSGFALAMFLAEVVVKIFIHFFMMPGGYHAVIH